jgi:hypothetical protein
LELDLKTTSTVQINITVSKINPIGVPLNNSIDFYQIEANNSEAIQFPINITFYYDYTALTSLGLSESDLMVWFFDTSTNSWVDIGGVVDTIHHSITIQITHFSVYAIAPQQTQNEQIKIGLDFLLEILVGVLVVGIAVFTISRLKKRSAGKKMDKNDREKETKKEEYF